MVRGLSKRRSSNRKSAAAYGDGTLRRDSSATALAAGLSPTPAATGAETQRAAPSSPDIQEVATPEIYTASQLYPDPVIVIKDVPVSLLMTRLHRKHVNQFTIEPFISSRPFGLPEEVLNVEFTPGQSG